MALEHMTLSALGIFHCFVDRSYNRTGEEDMSDSWAGLAFCPIIEDLEDMSWHSPSSSHIEAAKLPRIYELPWRMRSLAHTTVEKSFPLSCLRCYVTHSSANQTGLCLHREVTCTMGVTHMQGQTPCYLVCQSLLQNCASPSFVLLPSTCLTIWR